MEEVDVRFHRLKNFVLDLRNMQASKLAEMAIENPNVSGLPEYWPSVANYRLLEQIIDKAEKIESQVMS